MSGQKANNSLQKSLIRISIIIVIFISISVGTLCFDIYRRDMINRYQNYAGDAYPRDVALEYLQRMDTDTTVTYFRNDTDFGKIYTAIRPLINSKGEPIAVICGDILIDDIYKAAYTYALATFIVALIAGLLLVLALNRWYNKRIVRPIRNLENIDSLIDKFNQELSDLANNKGLSPWEAVSAAIGYATYDSDKDVGAINVFKRADNNMYENKKRMHAERT
jgi:GGDEF domain-containing protein